jgi:methyl-accepting chemotaxis protein
MNEKRSASLAHTFKLLVLVNCLCLAALAGAFMYQRSAQADAQAASQGQYKSYLLADEFRQSSDDLTRLVRTYAATGDSKYEKWYNQVIAMRNGEISRPQEPHRIYWDLILKDGDAPRPAGERKPLLEQMVEAGFTPAEMQLLEEGKKRSDALVQLEVRAMEAVKKADLKLATDLLYSEDYHKAKASVMGPVDKFFSLIGQRTAAQSAEAQSAVTVANIVMFIVGLLLMASIAATAFILQRRVMAPVSKLRDCMSSLSNGNLTVEVPMADRNDEIGAMAKALLVFKNAVSGMQSAEEAERQRQQIEEARARDEAARAEAARNARLVVDALGEGLQRLSRGDLTCRITQEFLPEYKRIQTDFNSAIGQLQETISAILASAHEVTNASLEISTSTTNLSERTEQQAASLEETSASMEEIAATVKVNAENAQRANHSAASTRDVADRGGAVVAQAVETMSRIEESSRNISDIIGVIDEIARQTNLLALNAAVEAARAGEAGRGFAVVASEVRSLAQRSSQAAKDITDLIVNSNGQVKEGVDHVNRVGAALADITESIKQVADIVSEIAAASSEQSAGIEQVNRALSQMDAVTQQNSALVEENAATAKTLEQQARLMSERIAQFRTSETASSFNIRSAA